MIAGGPGGASLVQASELPMIGDQSGEEKIFQPQILSNRTLLDQSYQARSKETVSGAEGNLQESSQMPANTIGREEEKEADSTYNIETEESNTELESMEEAETTQIEEIEEEKELQPVLYLDPIPTQGARAVTLNEEQGDGTSSLEPLRSLDATIERAKELQESLGEETITVYVMSPMEVNAPEEKVSYDGRGVRLVPWEGRETKDQLLFKVQEGTLELSDMELSKNAKSTEEILISVEAGNLEFGNDLEIAGKISVDYQNDPSIEPVIKVNSTLEESKVFGIQLEGISDPSQVEGKKIVEATYTEGDKGEELKKHFYLSNYEEDALTIEVDEEVETVLLLRKSTRSASDPIYWNVNPVATGTAGEPDYIPGGDDVNNNGLLPTAPVLTWEKVLEIGRNFEQRRVIVMSPVQVGTDLLPQDADGNYIIDGQGITTLEQYQNRNISTFIIEPDQELTLKDIAVVGGGASIRIVDPEEGASGTTPKLGKLKIDHGAVISPGYIQTELNAYSPEKLGDCTVELLTTDIGDNTYQMYYSGISDSMNFDRSDVIRLPEGEKAADYIGTVFSIYAANAADGWGLRPDTGIAGGSGPIENHIELYRDFIYEGVYLNGKTGNDEWFGGNSNWPVKTFEQAKKILYENWDQMKPEHRVIYICDTVTIDADVEWELGHVDENGLMEIAKVKACGGEETHVVHHTGPMQGILVNVQSGVTFTTSNIHFEYGQTSNQSVAIKVLAGGSYISAEGTSIVGNPNADFGDPNAVLNQETGYYGVGLLVEGTSTDQTTATIEDGFISKFGSGIIVTGGGTNTVVTMNDGEITENSQVSLKRSGGGIYLEDAIFDMNGGSITNNHGYNETNEGIGYGGGVYITGENSEFNMMGGEISQNKASGYRYVGSITYISKGSGVYVESGHFLLGGDSLITENYPARGYMEGVAIYIDVKASMTMTDSAMITYHGTSSTSYDWQKGAIATKGQVLIDGGTISNNTVGKGGGIYFAQGNLTFDGGTIENNKVSYGGAIYVDQAYDMTEKGQINLVSGMISGNEAGYYGGGVYVPTNVYKTNIIIGEPESTGTGEPMVFLNNIATKSGGGIYNGGYMSINSVVIQENKAKNGGGIYSIQGCTEINNADIVDNEAETGGGLYHTTSGTLVIKDADFFNNKATIEGASLYDDARYSYLLGGRYTSDETNGVYGIVINIATTNTAYKIYMNPINMDIQDKVYLNTTNSAIGILEALGDTKDKIDIYLNPEAFTTGSVIAYPAKLKEIKYNLFYNTPVTIPLNIVNSVEESSGYFHPGMIPPKTSIGGYNGTILLVGQGVYINGVAKSASVPSGGDDTNSGTSPGDAVYTFERAKELLGKYIAENPDGFEPYIYVCGEITIKANEVATWDLNPNDYLQANIDTPAQMKRFASYLGKMITVAKGGTLNLETIVIDGNGAGVNGYVQGILTIESKAKTTIAHGTIQNNRSNGIQVSGELEVGGTQESPSIIKNMGAYGITADAYGHVVMSGYSQIFNPQHVDGDVEKGMVPGYTNGGGIYLYTQNPTVRPNQTQIELKDHTSIQTTNMNGLRYGIFINAWGAPSVWADENEPRVRISDSAKILDSWYGIEMQGSNNVVKVEGSASLVNNKYAVHISKVEKDSQFIMSDFASIRSDSIQPGVSGESGIVPYQVATYPAVGDKPNLTVTLKNDAYIEKMTHSGMYLEQKGASYNINLMDNATLRNNTTGIFTYLYGVPAVGFKDHNIPEINLSGHSSITGSTNEGIRHDTGRVHYTLSEFASINNNGGNGVSLNLTHRDPMLTGAKVTLLDQTSISNNGGSGVETKGNGTGINSYANPVTVSIKDNSQITDNTKVGIEADYESVIEVRDTALIARNGENFTRGQGINTRGEVRLDGTAKIESEIFLLNPKQSIVLSILSTEIEDFTVGVTDKFIGQIVVSPDGTSISDTTPYLSHFHASKLPGNFPEGRQIISRSPNLIIDYENNVYLAGSGAVTDTLEPGNDMNNGFGPGAPVATFARAKEILKTLDPGANIIICNYTLDFGKTTSIKETGDTWSFDSGGNFTNNNGETWTPKVMRYKDFRQDLIVLEAKMNTQITFTLENIIIDGNGSEYPKTGDDYYTNYLIHNKGKNNTVNLNEGSVVQNNAFYVSNNTSEKGAAITNKGTLNINGGAVINNSNQKQYNRYGAGIYNYDGIINMTSGEISGNSISQLDYQFNAYRDAAGAGIYSEGGTLNLKGGKISENTIIGANAMGSAMYLVGKPTVNLSGGVQIVDNKIDSTMYNEGLKTKGTIYTNDAQIISTGAVISNNTIENATKYTSEYYYPAGAGIFATAGKISLSKTKIENNQALSENQSNGIGPLGGAIYLEGYAELYMTSGTIQNNKATRGAAIYTTGGVVKVSLAGGTIKNNTPVNGIPAVMENSGIFVWTKNFTIKGGGAIISDRIYLGAVSYPITLGGTIYQKNRLYEVNVAKTFKNGDVVVKPDGTDAVPGVIDDATPYLKNFAVKDSVYVLEKSDLNGKTLVLKKLVFIDSINGADSNTGINPDVPVKTMAGAQVRGGAAGHYIIYASGPIIVSGTENWTLPTNSWVTRYTGFGVISSQGGSSVTYKPYTNEVVRVPANTTLNLQGIAIYGRRSLDTNAFGESLLLIEEGGKATTTQDTLLSRNTTPTGKNGGAIYNKGTLDVKGLTINVVVAGKGSAIYQEGVLNLDGEPVILGQVYLAGKGKSDLTSHFISVTNGYKPGEVPGRSPRIDIGIENPFAGRKVVEYPKGITPTEIQQGYYALAPAVTAMYSLLQRKTELNVLELYKKGEVYLNGVAGSDSETGATPLESVKTLKRAYEILQETGGVIIVVDTVTVDSNISLIDDRSGKGLYVSGSDRVNANGRVSFLRYAQPTEWESLEEKEKYNVPTNKNILFHVTTIGNLETSGSVVFDGHSFPVVGDPRFASEGVEATSPIFDIEGVYKAGAGTTIFHNINITPDAKGAGIYIHGGTVNANGIIIQDVAAPNGKGSAIYHDGEFSLDGLPMINGDIHLTGQGTVDDDSTSKYIKVLLNGFQPKDLMNITVDDPYDTRPMIQYPSSSTIPGTREKNYFILEDKVTELYSLGNRPGNERMLELQYLPMVYVDGVSGQDSDSGATPEKAVKTLERAYELLSVRRGGYIYIVNTVTIESDIRIDSTLYSSAGVETKVVGGKVEVRRYVVPDDFSTDPEYTRKGTHLGPLFEISDGGTFKLSDIIVDGHKNERHVGDPHQDVSTTTKAKGPLMNVSSGGELLLSENSVLQNNNNGNISKGELPGGAVANFGSVSFDMTTFANNEAQKGSGIYQDGTFTIESGAEGIGTQEIYLAAHQEDSNDPSTWVDRIIDIQYRMDLATTKLSINVDHAVKGRNIAQYVSPDAYDHDLDGEYKFYELGSTITSVKPTLELVAADPSIEPDILELQNYEILDVEIPEEIFLVMVSSGTTARDGILNSPNYTIKNGGNYKTDVSVIGFTNDNLEAGITVAPWDLVDDPDGVNNDTDLYLAVDKSKDVTDNGFTELSEKSLATVSETNPIHFGTLDKNGSGSFTFKGKATGDFFKKFNDELFPLMNEDEQIANDHIKANARAKYQLIYAFELVRDEE